MVGGRLGLLVGAVGVASQNPSVGPRDVARRVAFFRRLEFGFQRIEFQRIEFQQFEWKGRVVEFRRLEFGCQLIEFQHPSVN